MPNHPAKEPLDAISLRPARVEDVDFLRNLGTRDGRTVVKPMGEVASRRLAGHTTSPTTVDWNADGGPDLLVGAEDGFFYYMRNPNLKPETR